MHPLNHLTEGSVTSLRDLPSQESPIPSDRYIIKHTEEAYVRATSGEIEAKIWFKSPPITTDTISRIRALKLFAESHDQAFCDDRNAGNWTWLELAILDNRSASSPRKTENDVELVWTSHMNELESSKFRWLGGEVFDERRDFLGLLEEGNVIAVRLCARFSQWSITAKNGYLVIDIGDQKVDRKPIQYDPIVSKINSMQGALSEVNNATESDFEPELPPGFNTANAVGKGAGEPPLRVLSFDGGGVRGLSSLMLLEAVMEKYAPDKKPCEVFDMIGGTSTGGLIAIMLGRLRMSVQECIEAYRKFMKTIFDKGLFGYGHYLGLTIKDEMYSSVDFSGIVKDLIKDKLGKNADDVNLLEDDNDEKDGHRCKIFVLAMRADAPNNREPVFMRSYKNTYKKSLLPNVKIWEAARATSAAPYYFSPMKVGKYKFIDGGLGANNPLGWLWTEVLGVYGASRETACFLSIGTGIPSNKEGPKTKLVSFRKQQERWAGIATNSEITHGLFNGLLDAFAPKPIKKKYWRLNVGELIPEWNEVPAWWEFWKEEVLHLKNWREVGDLDDVEKLKAFEQMTEKYIKDNDGLIEDCAKALRLK